MSGSWTVTYLGFFVLSFAVDLFEYLIFPHAAKAGIMSTENPDEPVSRLELTALIVAAVARALSSLPDPGGDGEPLHSSFFSFSVLVL